MEFFARRPSSTSANAKSNLEKSAKTGKNEDGVENREGRDTGSGVRTRSQSPVLNESRNLSGQTKRKRSDDE